MTTTVTEGRAEAEGKAEGKAEAVAEGDQEAAKRTPHTRHAESTRSTVNTAHRVASTEEEAKSDTLKTDQSTPKNDSHELNIN